MSKTNNKNPTSFIDLLNAKLTPQNIDEIKSRVDALEIESVELEAIRKDFDAYNKVHGARYWHAVLSPDQDFVEYNILVWRMLSENHLFITIHIPALGITFRGPAMKTILREESLVEERVQTLLHPTVRFKRVMFMAWKGEERPEVQNRQPTPAVWNMYGKPPSTSDKNTTSQALEILAKVLRERNRLTTPLRSPEDGVSGGWFMFVPPFFNNALDIKKTPKKDHGKDALIWTQGSAFSFKAGDTIYNSSDGYVAWTKAPNNDLLCVRITRASDAIPEKTAKNESAPRYSGQVSFSVYTLNEDKTALTKNESFEWTQDEFVRFLIVGPEGKLK